MPRDIVNHSPDSPARSGEGGAAKRRRVGSATNIEFVEGAPTRLALMSIVKPESAPVFPATICARWSSMRMIVQGWERSLETSVIKL
jgi:hypothetical protein